jgi:type I restriction enzyme S subunit
MAFTTDIPELIERNRNGLLGKHPSWPRVRLGDVVTVQNGAAFKSEYFNTEGHGMPLLRIRDVMRGATETWYDGPYDAEYVVWPGDLVIGMDGDFNHAFWTGPPALLNQRVCRLLFHGDGLNKKWVVHVLGGYLQAVNEATPSVTVKHLSSKTVADLLLPMPPREAQDRIVAVVEETFRQIEDGIASFGDAVKSIGSYERSLYYEAFSGGLVSAAVNGETADALLTRLGVDPISRAECHTGWPSNWLGARLGDLASHVTSGSRDWKPYYGHGTGVFVLTQSVRMRRLDLSDPFHVDPPEDDPARTRSAIAQGDILVTIVGANVGNTARVPFEVPEHYVCQSLALIRPREPAMSRFLELYLAAPTGGQAFFESCFYGQGRPHISFADIKRMPVPVPPLDEQAAIVSFFDRQVAAMGTLKVSMNGARKEASSLRQSVLHQAVAGHLIEPPTANKRRPVRAGE